MIIVTAAYIIYFFEISFHGPKVVVLMGFRCTFFVDNYFIFWMFYNMLTAKPSDGLTNGVFMSEMCRLLLGPQKSGRNKGVVVLTVWSYGGVPLYMMH